ncbi:Hypothetical predicted protein [Mytilus galloprovincialis]|uniref:AIG1-type G domain-containing protein n=1 Tax=Mytilus galloprovincialis TaxID=29158 RepID=A0A8B6G734_MYTGA|nr:Hypothetical predicted protein [Mytilus galloprovincialis]
MSSTGNSILGQTVFITESSGSSITNKCCIGTTKRDRKIVKVVDTPGFFGNSLTIEEIRQEVLNCFYLTKPGPHAIFYILRIGRFTNEEIQGVKRFLEIFGGDPLQYTVIILTGVDDLEWNHSSTEEYLDNAPITLKKLIEACNKRCVFFNNRLSNSENQNIQLKKLFTKVEKMLKDNKERKMPYYTNDIITQIGKGASLCAANEHVEADCRFPKLPKVAAGGAAAAGGAGAVIGGVFLFGLPGVVMLPAVGLVGIKIGYDWYKDSKKPNDKLSKVLEEIKEDSNIQCTIS